MWNDGFCFLALRSEWLLTDLSCPQVSTPVLSFMWTLRLVYMAICLGYYELSLLLVLVFNFYEELRRNIRRHLLLFSRSAVRTKKCSCFFQMFSIQYFILDPKTLRFPCCRSFFGQRIGWRKAKRSPNGLYPRLRFVSLKEPDWQRAINNSLPNVNTIFNCDPQRLMIFRKCTFALDWLWVCSKIVKKTIITRTLLESWLNFWHWY